MIVVMRYNASMEEVAQMLERIESEGLRAHLSRGDNRTVIGVIGDEQMINRGAWEAMQGVERVMPVMKPFKLASLEFKPEKSVIEVGDVKIGGDEVIVMAGPCAVESYDQIMESAHIVKAAGAKILRGGAFKPRTSPYAFQGLGEGGLKLLAAAREETGLLIVTEVMSPEQVDLVGQYTDIYQIGSRNMQNYALLRAVGKTNIPVLLKRGLAGTINELLMCAEYILSQGNHRVMLCERGIRSYEPLTRNTFDLNAIPVLNHLTHLPVIADPSHGTGKWEYVGAVTRGALAAGADGLLIEVHPDPANAASDGRQSLNPKNFAQLMTQCRPIAKAIGRYIGDEKK